MSVGEDQTAGAIVDESLGAFGDGAIHGGRSAVGRTECEVGDVIEAQVAGVVIELKGTGVPSDDFRTESRIIRNAEESSRVNGDVGVVIREILDKGA